MASESGKDESTKVHTDIPDLRNQVIESIVGETIVKNTYNAAGYRVAKSVTKGGKTEKTYFLYDGNNVIMEADEDGVTAKNTYGGPLLLRTEFDGADETTYEYLYNAHGDVVTLLSDGEVKATYYYDSFGNILEQTGDVDNSILYAGYQYDEETGLYYINARMYDPVTARFLQADTYAGSLNDPLSLNLYTYCLNNPHKYIDPSGHFVITAAAVLLIARIGISLFSGVMSAKAEYDRQVAEGDNYTNWGSVLFVGLANAGIAYFTFGLGQGAAAVAGAGVKAVVKQVGKAVIRDAAIGALADAGVETARQLVTGTRITNLEYDRIADAGIYGGFAGGASSLAGVGLEGLMKTRVAQSVLKKVNLAAGKGADAIKNGFAKIASKNGKTVGTEAVTGLQERKFKLNLQFFASDEVYQSGSKTKWWHEGYVDDLSDTQVLLGVKQSDKGLSTLGSSTRENAMLAGKAWVGDNYNVIKDGAGNVLGYSSADGMRAYRIQYKPREGMWRANFQENIFVNNPYPNPGQHISQIKNVHIDILD